MEKLIGERLEERSAVGIASTIGSLMTDGDIKPGDKLPTVRSLASHLGVSANSVSEAWRILRAHGAISTDRRRGTVARARRVELGGRYWQVPVEPGTIELDLSTGTPDIELLPPIGPVLHRLHATVAVTSYLDPPILVELEKELRQRWPFDPAAITVVDGAQDALDRVVGELVNLGDTVVVEDPTFPPLLDMLELAGATIIGVPLDDEGPMIDALEAAMTSHPAVIFTQPRAHNPTGVHISATRTKAIAASIVGTRTIVVEDDHSAGAAAAPLRSVGSHAPDNTVHIHSFSKSHGPDLRIAAIGGPRQVIGSIVRRRQLGPSWTSRLIQQILLTMLTDSATEALVASAAEVYRERRDDLGRLLADHGVVVRPGVGLNMWIPVIDELQAVVALAAHGIGVAPGSPFRVSKTAEQHIRLSVGTLRGDLSSTARTIADAAKGHRPAIAS